MHGCLATRACCVAYLAITNCFRTHVCAALLGTTLRIRVYGNGQHAVLLARIFAKHKIYMAVINRKFYTRISVQVLLSKVLMKALYPRSVATSQIDKYQFE